MGIADVVIIAFVVVAVALCLRHLMRSHAEGGCASCSCSGSCAASHAGSGSCPVSDRLVDAAEKSVPDVVAGRTA